MSTNDQSLHLVIFVQQVKQLLGHIGNPLLARDFRPDFEQLHQLLDPLGQPGVTVPGDVRLEVQLVVLGVHHGEGVVLVLVVAQPRPVGEFGKQHDTGTIVRATVALFLFIQRVVRTKDVREVFVILALCKFVNLDLRFRSPHGLVVERGRTGHHTLATCIQNVTATGG